MSLPPAVQRLTQRCFGQSIIRNDLRGELVEEIVAMALEPDWVLCGGDWAAFDLKQVNGPLRMQVKQSAALQSWTLADGPKSRPCFSIKTKKYRWEGPIRLDDAGRHADVFVFGWHDRTDAGSDHRDPEQWQFFVVAERDLPMQKTIALSALRGLAKPVPFAGLAKEVQALGRRLTDTPPG